MKRKYKSDYTDENRRLCLKHAEEHLPRDTYKEVIGSFCHMAVRNMVALILLAVVLLVSYGYILYTRFTFGLGPFSSMVALFLSLLAMALSTVAFGTVLTLVYNIINNTVGRKWFRYYMMWYDAYH